MESPRMHFLLPFALVLSVALGSCVTARPAPLDRQAVDATLRAQAPAPALQVCEGDFALDDSVGLDGCEVIRGSLHVQGWLAPALAPLPGLVRIEGSLHIQGSTVLTTLDGLSNLETITGDLYLVDLPGLRELGTLARLSAVGGDIELVGLGLARCRAEAFVAGLARGDRAQTSLVGLDEEATCPPPDGDSPDDGSPGDTSPAPDGLIRLVADDAIPGGHHLGTVHPEIARRARYLYALALEEGIELQFISGHRKHRKPPKGSRRLTSWHTFGMGLDLNLAHHPTMNAATRAFAAERDQWYAVGALIRGLGMVWGESFDDIFHLEWHPGFHDRIRADEFKRLRARTGQAMTNYRAAWSLFEPPTTLELPENCFGGCWEIPDDVLRERVERTEALYVGAEGGAEGGVEDGPAAGAPAVSAKEASPPRR